MQLFDTGEGMDFPVIEKGDYCLFDNGENYILRKKNKGIVKKYPKNKIMEARIESLVKKNKWRWSKI